MVGRGWVLGGFGFGLGLWLVGLWVGCVGGVLWAFWAWGGVGVAARVVGADARELAFICFAGCGLQQNEIAFTC